MDKTYWYNLKGGFTLEGTKKARIYLLPDFSLTAISLLPIAEYLNGLGYSVRGVTYHEHDTPEGIATETLEGYLKRLTDNYLTFLRTGEHVYYVGVGFGALLAVLFAAEQVPSGLYLINPSFGLGKAAKKPGLFGNKKIVKFPRPILANHAEEYLVGVDSYEIDSLSLYQEGYKRVKKSVSNLVNQVYAVISDEDDWSDNDKTDEFLKSLPGLTGFDYKHYQKSDHFIYLEPEYKEVADSIDKFIRKNEERAEGIAKDDAVVTAGLIFGRNDEKKDENQDNKTTLEK